MSVSYIEGIYNNSAHDIFMWAVDDDHLGVIRDAVTGQIIGQNDNGEVVTLKAGGQYRAEWCGIPWYRNEDHFRALSTSPGKQRNQALLMWQSIVDTADGVVFVHGSSMKRVGGHEFGREATRHYALTIDPPQGGQNFSPVEISLELRNTDDTGGKIVNLLGKVLGDAYDDMRTIRIEAGKAVAGKLAGDS